MFEDKYFNYGILKVEDGYVKVFCAYNEYRPIVMCGHIVDAYWSGRSIITRREGETDRVYRWTDFDTYEMVML